MNRTRLHNWIELVGLVAIVSSLIFVGLELKQSREVAIAGQYQDRANIGADYFLSRLENEHLIAYLGIELAVDYESDRLGPTQKEHFEEHGPESLAFNYLHMNIVFLMYDNIYFQFENGFLTEESWAAIRYQLKGALGYPLWVEFFQNRSEGRRKSFRDLCFQLLAEIEAEENSDG